MTTFVFLPESSVLIFPISILISLYPDQSCLPGLPQLDPGHGGPLTLLVLPVAVHAGDHGGVVLEALPTGPPASGLQLVVLVTNVLVLGKGRLALTVHLHPAHPGRLAAGHTEEEQEEGEREAR